MSKSNCINFNFNFGSSNPATDELSQIVGHLQESTLQRFEKAVQQNNLEYVAKDAAIAMAPSGTVLATAPKRNAEAILAYVYRGQGNCGCKSKLKAGLYEMAFIENRATLFFFSPEEGRIKIHFQPRDSGETEFSTPLGDDMCEKAPDIIMNYCQSFVACAAYDLFC